MAHRIFSRVEPPFIQVLVQKSVTTITNVAGRLSMWMLGKNREIRKRVVTNSWYSACQRLWLPGAALIFEHFVQGVREIVGALQVFHGTAVVIALQEMIFVSNV
jgi:hypothetical protein